MVYGDPATPADAAAPVLVKVTLVTVSLLTSPLALNSVPANVTVTQVAPEKVTLAAGDTIYLTTDKLPNGTLSTNKILVIAPAASSNTKQ